MAAQENVASDGQNWCYLDAAQQSQGPFPVSYLKELAKAGYFNPDVLFWKEGEAEWTRLDQLPALSKALTVHSIGTSSDAAAQAPNSPEKAISLSTAGGGAEKQPSAPAAPSQAPEDPELSLFLSEVEVAEREAAEGAAVGQTAGNDAPDPGSIPSPSPSPSERSFEDDDGMRYEWSSAARRFLPQESGGAAPSYDEADMVFVPEVIPQDDRPLCSDGEASDLDLDAEETAPRSEKPPASQPSETAREAGMRQAREKMAKQQAAAQAQNKDWFELKHNTSVYVSGLPSDATETELKQAFGKCGIIKEDESRRPRIKLYRTPSGTFKGDALVTFLKEPSVPLALQILDGTPLRDAAPGDPPAPPMQVSPARFEKKGDAFRPRGSSGGAAQAGLKKRRRKVLEQQERRALGWGGLDSATSRASRTVVLRQLFDPGALEREPRARAEIEADVRAEAERLGRVEALKLHAQHPDAAVSVRFAAPEAAQRCVQRMHGRLFDGRVVRAALWDGVETLERRREETEEEQARRLEAYAQELERGEA